VITPAIAGLAVGAVLGTRFNVFILFPAMLAGVLLNIGIASTQGTGFWQVLIALALSITGLQLGFVVGGIAWQGHRERLQAESDIPEAEQDQQQDLQLVAAKQLDDMVPELIALSKQLAEPPSATDQPTAAAPSARSARSKVTR
jgi:hypothetical protein